MVPAVAARSRFAGFSSILGLEKVMIMLFRLYCPKNSSVRISLAASIFVLLLIVGSAESSFAQTPPLAIFKNYFVTGDYVVGGWVEQSSANGFATGTISIPDCTQAAAMGQACPPPPVPAGADVVAAYLYWATVEGSQSTFAGQQAFFNGYKIIGDVLGNPNAPTSWSSGGCTGSSTGSKTMRMYRADVRPYLPLDLNSQSPTFGALAVNPTVVVNLADSGSNGNTQPNALGATLVLIYRVLSPSTTPLNAIVLYDGSYAPSNALPSMTQNLVGFYEPDSIHSAKLTHIVANGQANKGETVFFGSNANALNPLTSLYGANPPFPGVYGAWDNPTWNVSSYVHGGDLTTTFDTQETTAVTPTSTNSGCVNWGAIVFSTTVQDYDNDGLLDVWEGPAQGYTDAVSGQSVTLPGADRFEKDLFVQLDYLALRDGSNNVLHSHLPKQAALDAVGEAFSAHNINVHFDLPSGIYGSDPYVISTVAGGNEISESSLLCTDGTTLCAFPGQPAISWKGGFEFVKNDPNLGNFQPGRAQSYRYALSGHALGEPRSYWGAVSTAFAANDPQHFAASVSRLVSIAVTGNSATVTLKSPSLIEGVPPLIPPLVLKPGDCSANNPPPLPTACGDANHDRVTISGSLPAPILPPDNIIPTPHAGTPPLNGTYLFSNAVSSPPDATTGIITTTFQVTTSGVPDGTYQFSCDPNAPTNPPCVADPQLGVSYLGPTSSSGHSDFGGGGDLAETLGLWGADDVQGCEPNPANPEPAQGYCNNQVGTLNVQTGTLMHELGHMLTLTHGGTYYDLSSNTPSVPTYEGNCKPNFISIMNYLFQVRGFVDNNPLKFDYSGQNLPNLDEGSLSESQGVNLGSPADHLTRWYSMPNAADLALGDQALAHCDGSPIAQGESAGVRVDGSPIPAIGGTIPTALDWNNDLLIPNTVVAPGEDLNHNGKFGDDPFSGFDDWASIDLRQTNARASGFGFSEGGGLNRSGGGLNRSGGGIDSEGGGLNRSGGGLNRSGGGLNRSGGGIDQDTETANSTVTAPSNLSCKKALTNNGTPVPACTGSSAPFLEKGKAIPLTWTSPNFGQIRSYTVLRAMGSFQTMQQVVANIGKFSQLTTLTGTPPTTSFVDTFNLKSNTTYTYIVTDSNKFGAHSGASIPLVVLLKF